MKNEHAGASAIDAIQKWGRSEISDDQFVKNMATATAAAAPIPQSVIDSLSFGLTAVSDNTKPDDRVAAFDRIAEQAFPGALMSTFTKARARAVLLVPPSDALRGVLDSDAWRKATPVARMSFVWSHTTCRDESGSIKTFGGAALKPEHEQVFSDKNIGGSVPITGLAAAVL
jgi:hypothetical protein